MTKTIIRVPNLGDFADVPVIEVHIKPGDRIEADQSLVTVESDKATMDIPAPVSGKLIDVIIGVGDMVREGTILANIETEDETASDVARPLADIPEEHNDAIASSAGNGAFDLVVIGGGPGGYSAAFRAADLGLRVALIEERATLGGVCLNVGCIPSKALLHVAAVSGEAQRLASHGVHFAPPEYDLDKLRAYKDKTVGRLTAGLSHMAKMRDVTIIQGTAAFANAHAVSVDVGEEAPRIISFKQCIIAAGSSPVHLPFLPDDPRIVDSTGALELPVVPEKMLVVGGGIIGLEMATVYSALGARIDVVEQMDGLLAGVDRDLVAIWMKRNKHRFDRMMTATTLRSVTAKDEGLEAAFEGAGCDPATYDLILQAPGRRPNGDRLHTEVAGLSHDRGFIRVDQQMRTEVPHIFAIGDIVGQPMLAHKAVHEGHAAAEVAAGQKAAFDAQVIPSVAYTDPEIAWVGMTEDAARETGEDVDVGRFPWAASGRAIANGADYGLTKLIFSKQTGRIVGGAVIGPNAGDLIGEICLAIEMGCDAIDVGHTIHPHPTLGESIGMAAEEVLGVCTDLPRKTS